VSLLSGHGYRYADGHPIIFWPPGFAGYLAVWQAMFGISVGTLVKAQIALGAFAALSWTALALSIGNSDSHPRLASGVVTALLIAAAVSRSFQSPWANFALFALIPWLLWATSGWMVRGRLPALCSVQGLRLSRCCSCSSLITRPSPFSRRSSQSRSPERAASLAAAAIVLIAPLIWWVVRGYSASGRALNGSAAGIH
jgi:hypothetical protein